MNAAMNKRFKVIVQELKQSDLIKSQIDLAEMYGFHKTFIGKMMNGQSPVTIEMIDLLLKRFRVSADYMFGNHLPKFIPERKSNYVQILAEDSPRYGDKSDTIQLLNEQLLAQKETIKTQKQLIDTLMGNRKAKAS